MPLATWLIALAWPIAKKVLVSLGIGIVTYGGLQMIGAQISDAVLNAWGQLGGYALAILSLAGIPECIGIILGGINARIALIAVGKIGKVASQ
ncbi:MAG: DUF2523 domain-containing protein [Rhodocyclaceae bacterium]|nr:DUF2523 domain-containing protein [Rhodocyclaceae bacterium]